MEDFIRQAGNARSARRRSLMLLAATVLFLTALGVIVTDKAHAQGTDPGGDFVDGEIVAKLNLAALGPAETCRAAISGINNSNGTTIKEVFLENQNVACIYLLQASPGSDTEQVAGSIAADPKVRYAEPNFTVEAPEGERYRHRGYPGSDPTPPSPDRADYDSQYAVGALDLTRAHGVSQGAGSTVAVLDTGVQQDHPELAGRVVKGESFVKESTSTEDTGNGLDDDADGLEDEMVGHGTHVAGIVHLTAPEAKIMPLRVLDSDGNGNVFLIAEAAEYAINNGADVINMSLGSSGESELLSDVIESLSGEDDDSVLENVPEEGVVVVASAGNEDASAQRHPAAGAEGEGEGVLSVTSVDAQEEKSGFANYDNRLYAEQESWVDIAAPGSDISSLFPTDQYAGWSGTSMAAPFVAGQAALLRGLAPGADATGTGEPGCPSVERLIEDNARSLDAQNPEYVGKLGAGHADANASLQALKPQAANCPPPDTEGTPSNTAPVISAVRPAPGSATRDRTPLLTATVRDAQANLTKDDVSMALDGRPRADFAYDTNDNDRLVYGSGKLSYGSHTMRISAEDPEGLIVNETWRFRVVRG